MRAYQLTKNKHGRVVSRAQSALRTRTYKGSKLEAWINACNVTRVQLGIVGFVKINGPTATGKAWYAKARAIYDEHLASRASS